MTEKPKPESDERDEGRFQRTVENLLKAPPKPHSVKAPAKPEKSK